MSCEHAQNDAPTAVIGPDNAIAQVLPDMPSRQEVIAEIARRWHPSPAVETIPVDAALGRVLARDVTAAFDFPPAQTSGRDGIAVRFDDFANGIPDTSAWVRDRDYATADTGDDVPDAFDTVIQVEDLVFAGATGLKDGGTPGGHSFEDGFAISVAPEQRGQHVNAAGSAFRAGDVIVPTGVRLTPERLSAAVACGATQLDVLARPRVGIIPTGDELVPAGTTPGRGKTVNSNATLLAAYVRLLGGEPVVHDIVLDRHDLLAEAVDEALACCDIVLVNAGSSKGSEDCGPLVLAERAECVIHHSQRCAPGKPAMSALTPAGQVMCVIPGPPIACDSAMHWLVFSLVAQWFGLDAHERLAKAVVEQDMPAKPFEVWRRCTLERGEDGRLTAHLMPMGGAPVLGRADGVLRTPTVEDYHAGDEVDVLLLDDGFSL
ncbi:MAG: molybdopterin molybdotransferase MoeA [Coriobacteriia bacterium]|nr:molybdopterin molybdotransferase MoeA [Coriobacteriia bacterium]MBS5477407.1 molybdopterin molybdotransferase MoeA [Coriobacteriia bacterium]